MKLNIISKNASTVGSFDLGLYKTEDGSNEVLKDLENPEKKITNAIQVVGTNGKHSVCTALREIFETSGYSVSMNVSPSLRNFNERYYLSGKHISNEKLYNLLAEVEKVNSALQSHFQGVGATMSKEWAERAGSRGASVLSAYK